MLFTSKKYILIFNVRYYYFDRIVSNRSNVAEPMSKTLVSIECRRIEQISIECRSIDRLGTRTRGKTTKRFCEMSSLLFLEGFCVCLCVCFLTQNVPRSIAKFSISFSSFLLQKISLRAKLFNFKKLCHLLHFLFLSLSLTHTHTLSLPLTHNLSLSHTHSLSLSLTQT